MLKDKSMTYVTLFSSAGVGCHGFQMEGEHCMATNAMTIQGILSVILHLKKSNREYTMKFTDGRKKAMIVWMSCTISFRRVSLQR